MFLSQNSGPSNPFSFLELCCDTVDIAIYLPFDKLIEIKQFAHAYLLRKPVIVCKLMSFWGKTTFCATGDVQCCQLCHAIQSIVFNVHHSPTQLFLPFSLFSPSTTSLSETVFIAGEFSNLVISHHWAFYFQDSGDPVSCCGTMSGSMCMVYIALQELQTFVLILHKIAFQLSGKVTALDNSTAKVNFSIKALAFQYTKWLMSHLTGPVVSKGLEILQVAQHWKGPSFSNNTAY